MTIFLTIAVIVLIYIVIFQIAKASEYVSVLKGEDVSRKQNNKINGFLMVAFLTWFQPADSGGPGDGSTASTQYED